MFHSPQSVPLGTPLLPGRCHQRCLPFIIAALLLFASACHALEVRFEDYDDQDSFNVFSGNSGIFEGGSNATISTSFNTNECRGTAGASLRVDYSVSSGYVGIWNSLVGKAGSDSLVLDFTDIYGDLLNSSGNPAVVENIPVTNFFFWAKGNGTGTFDHTVKIEFKTASGAIARQAVVSIPNTGDWSRYAVDLSGLPLPQANSMKQIVFVFEDWRNAGRSSHLYIDDLGFSFDEPDYDATGWSNEQFLDLVQHRAFAYFLRFTDQLGFVHDRSTSSDLVSVAGIGFQLAAYCIGENRGWASNLETRVQTIVENLYGLPMGPEADLSKAGHRGFYYHFLDAGTGLRKDDAVELSIYDTMLLHYGLACAKAAFPSNGQIQAVCRQLYDRTEWDWMLDVSPGVNSNRFHLAWYPEPAGTGTFSGHIDGYTDEALLVDVLALGSTGFPVTVAAYHARNRTPAAYPDGTCTNIVPSWTGSMFTYLFADNWLNLQDEGRDLHSRLPLAIWENNRRAIAANRRFCMDHADHAIGDGDDDYATYGSNSWGLTACDNLAPPASAQLSEYFAFGGLPTEQNMTSGAEAPHLGTIAVYGAAGAINFMPSEAQSALRHFYSIPGLWHPLFGFGDAFTLDPHYFETNPVNGAPIYGTNGNLIIHFADHLNGPWINNMQMAIDAGPMLLALENHRSQSVWSWTASNDRIRTGIDTVFGEGARVTNIVYAANGFVELHWQSVSNAQDYVVHETENLTGLWQQLTHSISDVQFTDTSAGSVSSRFYSVKGRIH